MPVNTAPGAQNFWPLEMPTIMCGDGLNEKFPSERLEFEHLEPSWWDCLGWFVGTALLEEVDH